jgi:hypothetical protein
MRRRGSARSGRGVPAAPVGTRAAFSAAGRTDTAQSKEVHMYIGIGTILVVLLIVLLYMLITGRSA